MILNYLIPFAAEYILINKLYQATSKLVGQCKTDD